MRGGNRWFSIGGRSTHACSTHGRSTQRPTAGTACAALPAPSLTFVAPGLCCDWGAAGDGTPAGLLAAWEPLTALVVGLALFALVALLRLVRWPSPSHAGRGVGGGAHDRRASDNDRLDDRRRDDRRGRLGDHGRRGNGERGEEIGLALANGHTLQFVAWLSTILTAAPDPERDGALARALGRIADALDAGDASVSEGDAPDEIRVGAGRIEVPLRAGGGSFGALVLAVPPEESMRWLARHEPAIHLVADLVAAALYRSRTARRLARNALLEDALLDALGGPAALLDGTGAVVRVNAAWDELGRAGRGPLGTLPPVGGDFLGLLAGGPVEEVAAVLAGSSSGFDTEVATADGGGVELVVAPLRAAGGVGPRGGGALVVQRDVTARRRAAAEAQHNRDEAAHMARVIAAGALASSFAHELNQPLTAMRTNAQAAIRLLANEPTDVEEIRDILHDITADAARAGDVIQRLRGLIKHDEPHLELLDINDVVKGAVRLVSTEAHIRRVALAVDTDPALPRVRGDRVQLQQVVLNLVINACEAMDDRAGVGRGLSNAPARRLTIQTGAVADGLVELTVHDTGPGIPADALDRVFAPFYSTKRHGLGVGLSITRSIVEAHGGRITAANDPLGGAIFRIRLPVVMPEEREGAHEGAAAGVARAGW